MLTSLLETPMIGYALFLVVGGSRGVLRPVAREGLQNLGSFLATKWAQNVILVGLGLGP